MSTPPKSLPGPSALLPQSSTFALRCLRCQHSGPMVRLADHFPWQCASCGTQLQFEPASGGQTVLPLLAPAAAPVPIVVTAPPVNVNIHNAWENTNVTTSLAGASATSFLNTELPGCVSTFFGLVMLGAMVVFALSFVI